MRRLILAAALLLGACGTETIELVSDAGARDLGVVDTGVDAGVDTGVDGGIEDGGPEDSGVEDTGTPDTGSECVCRFLGCMFDVDCETAIGRGSTCDTPPVCSGAIDTCRIDEDCGERWMCTTTAESLDPC